jgi:hypothetical protein
LGVNNDFADALLTLAELGAPAGAGDLSLDAGAEVVSFPFAAIGFDTDTSFRFDASIVLLEAEGSLTADVFRSLTSVDVGGAAL